MAGIMAAMKNFNNLGTVFSNNPALKAVQQAQQRKQAQQQAVSQVAGVAGAAPTPATPAASAAAAAPVADTSGLEARIAALESSGSNMASAPSSMDPRAIATGEAMFGNQDQRNNSINPFNSALI
jgi:hypothetical protein